MAYLGRIINVKQELPTEASLVEQPQPAQHITPPEVQLRDAMIRAGVTPPHDIVMDGKIHRYATGDKRGDKSGWYVAYADGVPAGSFGCWRSLGEGAIAWRADIGRSLSYEEEMAFAARQAQAKREREAENARIKLEGAQRARERWENASPECMAHPYVARKGFTGGWQPGWRMTADGCIVAPLMQSGEIVGLQSIGPDGDKQFDFGSTATGSWWTIGPVHGATDRVYITEGVATGGSVAMATHKAVAVAYSAQNLPAVAKAVRAVVSPECEIVIVADNDKPNKRNGEKAGQKWAEEAARDVPGCRAVVVPTWMDGQETADANDYFLAGLDLRGLLEGGGSGATVDAVQAAIDALEAHPLAQFVEIDGRARAPKWIIPGFIEAGVITIAGARGVGKTTSLLPLAMAAAGLHGEGYSMAPKADRWRHVVYIVEHVEQAQRIIAGLVQHSGLGMNPKDVTERLHLVEAKRLEPKELVTVGKLYRHKFSRTVRGVAIPPLVVFDTKAAVLAMENENDNSEASRAIALLKQEFAELPCWIIGHIAKANFGSKDMKSLSDRGAGAFEADTVQNLYLIEEDGRRFLSLGKRRFEADMEELEVFSGDATVEAYDEWGDVEMTKLRWGILDKPDSPRDSGKDSKKPESEKPAVSLNTARQDWQEAWIDSGAEMVEIEGKHHPYIAKAALSEWVYRHGVGMGTNKDGELYPRDRPGTLKTAQNWCGPSGRLVSHLCTGNATVDHNGSHLRAADSEWIMVLQHAKRQREAEKKQ